MSEEAAFGPYRFSLTEAEARAATARLALRYGLARRFERDYVAPLVFFVLLLLFVAILAFTGLIGRRPAEAALLGGAILFLATRLLAHQRLRRAQNRAKGAVDRIAASGEALLTIDETGLVLRGPTEGHEQRGLFLDLAEAEDAGGALYFWRRGEDGAPIILPTWIFGSPEEAERVLAFARRKIGGR